MRLIDDVKDLHKFASVRLAAAFGALVAYLAAHPEMVISLSTLFPEGPQRTLWHAFLGFLAFSAPVIARALTKSK